MTRFVQQITQQLIERLPDNDQYYRLDEMRSWGFPTFIVKRIKIELERNLAESMIIPKTDWANIESDAVQYAWQQFVDAIRAEARLPASYAKTVIETAVADVVEMLVQPRKNIPEVVFGTDEKLTYKQICDRVSSVVVYRHFASLLPRYMQKRDLNELSKKKCAEIVAKADQKFTARYSPLNWAQMLEPLFNLLDGDIDTDLLRLFYEDKEMHRIADAFDSMKNSLSRARLIEVLSSPALLDFEGEEDTDSSDANRIISPVKQQNAEPQKETGAAEEKVDTEKEFKAIEEKGKKADIESSDDTDEKPEPKKEESEDTINTIFTEPEDGKAEEGETEEDEDSLNAAFTEDEEEKETAVEEVQDAEESDKETENWEDLKSQEGSKDEKSGKTPTGEDDNQPTPMWMRYMSKDEIAEYKEKQLQEEDEESEDQEVEEGFIDEPIIDLTSQEAAEEEIEEVTELLSDEREHYVEEIFRGSERAYDEAVEKIAAFNDWRSASKYIQKDIFKRNLVDMYCEEAVDFTDRLQSYFLEKKNQK